MHKNILNLLDKIFIKYFLNVGYSEGTTVHCVSGLDASETIANQLSKSGESARDQECVSEGSATSARPGNHGAPSCRQTPEQRAVILQVAIGAVAQDGKSRVPDVSDFHAAMPVIGTESKLQSIDEQFRRAYPSTERI